MNHFSNKGFKIGGCSKVYQQNLWNITEEKFTFSKADSAYMNKILKQIYEKILF